MDQSAIQHIEQTAIDAAKANRLDTFIPSIILRTNTGQEIDSLESFGEGRARFRGTFSTPSFEDFVTYVDENASDHAVPVFVNPDSMSARAFFNLGTVDNPGHADWRGDLTLKATAAFDALRKIDGTRLKQKDLAEWLEDWNDFVAADYEGGNGDLKRAITGIRKLNIKKQGESVHGVTATGAERSEMEKIEAQADELPLGFTWVCEPYVGLKQRTFRLAFSILTGGDVPLIVLRWQRREAAIEDIAKEFSSTLNERLKAGAVTVGSFSA